MEEKGRLFHYNVKGNKFEFISDTFDYKNNNLTIVELNIPDYELNIKYFYSLIKFLLF